MSGEEEYLLQDQVADLRLQCDALRWLLASVVARLPKPEREALLDDLDRWGRHEAAIKGLAAGASLDLIIGGLQRAVLLAEEAAARRA